MAIVAQMVRVMKLEPHRISHHGNFGWPRRDALAERRAHIILQAANHDSVQVEEDQPLFFNYLLVSQLSEVLYQVISV